MKLLLFDIDGTLVRTNGSGRRAVENALSELVGRPVSTGGVGFSGKTDPQIMREVLGANDVTVSDELVQEAIDVYTQAASDAMHASDVTMLPGVADLLNVLHAHDDAHLGIVTGNVEHMAYRKLEAVEIDRFFGFGAFGSDHPDRNRLPPLAIDRAHAHTGIRFAAEHVVVIGDTGRDVECSRESGARAVAVCTGHYGRDDLAAHEPDALLDDLRDTDAALHALGLVS